MVATDPHGAQRDGPFHGGRAHEDWRMMVTLDSPRGWVHPDAVRVPAVEIFRPWPPEPAPESVPTHWQVVTEASRYVLDLEAGTATRYNLDVRDLAPGSVHAQLRRDTEQLKLLAVVDCR